MESDTLEPLLMKFYLEANVPWPRSADLLRDPQGESPEWDSRCQELLQVRASVVVQTVPLSWGQVKLRIRFLISVGEHFFFFISCMFLTYLLL